MGMTPQQCKALGVAVLILLILVVAGALHHNAWMKKHCVCTGGTTSAFHGWRYQHYDDNPYTQQKYHCGYGGEGYYYPRQKPNPIPPPVYPRTAVNVNTEHFGGDDQNWPQAGSFGAYADTYGYGNYADSLQTFYPTFDEYNPYWTRA